MIKLDKSIYDDIKADYCQEMICQIKKHASFTTKNFFNGVKVDDFF